MGLDIGDRTVGVAVSDPTASLAQGVGTIRRTTQERDVSSIADLATSRGAELIVAGLPRTLRGEVGVQADKVLGFVAALRKACPIPVELWDERLTTRIAERALLAADVSRARRRQVVDQVAATVLLQGFLDARRVAAAQAGQEAEDQAPSGDTQYRGHGSGFGPQQPGPGWPKRGDQGVEREEGDLVVLTDENGEEHEFELVDVFEVDGKEYAVLASTEDEDEDDEEAIVLRVEKDAEGNDQLVDIEDDEEWDKVAARWDEILEDEASLEWDEDDEDDDEDAEDDEDEDDEDEDEDEGDEPDDGKGSF